ncbi:hypothetical protein Tco_0727813 [Tanacetum coccineum]|uniref:Uncharacterized protein n=1 Tax=Tanacetum coccineum TaxID=301880 RepID=A0ABQ4YLW1_9ASTR
MSTFADKSLLSGGDNKPPMLEKHLYDSWKSRIGTCYMRIGSKWKKILASVETGTLVWPSITEVGVKRALQNIVPEKGDDPIDAINHMISFLTCYGHIRFLLQQSVRDSSNPRPHASIFDGKSNCATVWETNYLMLLDFLDIQTSQTVFTTLLLLSSMTWNAYDSDCDELNSAKIASYRRIGLGNGSHALNELETEITSDSNIIPYSQYLSEAQQETVQILSLLLTRLS